MTMRDGSVPYGAAFIPQPPRSHVGTLHAASVDSSTGAVLTVTNWAGRILRIYVTEDMYYLFHQTATNQIDTTAALTTAPVPNAGGAVTSGDADEIPGIILASTGFVDVMIPEPRGKQKSGPAGEAVYLHLKAVADTGAVRAHPSS